MEDNLCYQKKNQKIVKQQRNYKKQKYRHYKILKTKMENKDIAKQNKTKEEKPTKQIITLR
jgi:hypothetical protein